MNGIRAAAAGAELTPDEATRRVLAVALSKAPTMGGRELAELMEGIAKLRMHSGVAGNATDISQDLAEWIRGE